MGEVFLGLGLGGGRALLLAEAEGYSASGSICSDNLQSKTIFDINFSQYRNLDSASVSSFESLEQYKFTNTNVYALIPSPDRGFFSGSNSVLISKENWNASPYLTILGWINISYQGTISEVYSGSGIFLRFSVTETDFTVYFASVKQADSNILYTTFVGPAKASDWRYVKYQIFQDTAAQITINFWLDSSLSTESYENLEFATICPFNWYIGSLSKGNTFRGYLSICEE